MIYEVLFGIDDDGLMATRPTGSYLLFTQKEAEAEVSRLKALGYEAEWKECSDEYLDDYLE